VSAYHLLVAFLILFLCLPFVASLPMLTRNSVMGGGEGLVVWNRRLPHYNASACLGAQVAAVLLG